MAPGLIDLDMCLLEIKTTVSSDDSSSGSKAKLKDWKSCDLLSLVVFKRPISNIIYDDVPVGKLPRSFLMP